MSYQWCKSWEERKMSSSVMKYVGLSKIADDQWVTGKSGTGAGGGGHWWSREETWEEGLGPDNCGQDKGVTLLLEDSMFSFLLFTEYLGGQWDKERHTRIHGRSSTIAVSHSYLSLFNSTHLENTTKNMMSYPQLDIKDIS